MGYNQYNLKTRSIYLLFNSYSKEIIDFVLNTFSKEVRTYKILEKHFGASFNGENLTFLNELDYTEEKLLEGILTRIEERLKAINILLKNGKNLEEIKSLFKSKKDIEISNIVKNIISKEKAKEFSRVFVSTDTILNNYNINIEELLKAVYEIPSKKDRLCFIYTFGLEGTKLEPKTITKILNITSINYERLLESAKNQIDRYLTNKKIKEEQTKPKVKIKPKPIAKKKLDLNSPEERREYIDKMDQIMTKTKVEHIQKKQLMKRTPKTSFYDWFDKYFSSKLSKRIIKELVDEFISSNSEEAVSLIKKVYGETLDEKKPVLITSKEELIISNYRTKIKDYINEKVLTNTLEKSNDDKLKENSSKKPQQDNTKVIKRKPGRPRNSVKFHDSFRAIIYENYPQVSKEDLDLLIDECMNNNKSNKKELLKKLYGENLDSLNKSFLKTNYKQAFYYYRRTIFLYIDKALKNSLKPTFYDYFITKDLQQEQIIILKEIIKREVLLSDKKDLIYKKYGYTLDKPKDILLTKKEQQDFNNLIDMISNKINSNSKQTFFDHFITSEMSESQKQQIIERVKKYVKASSTVGKDITLSLYGPNLDTYNPNNLNNDDKIIYKRFIESIKKHLNNTEKRLPNNFIYDSFFDYFFTSKMSESNKNNIKKIVLEYFNKSKSAKKSIVIKLYGENLDKYTGYEMNYKEKKELLEFIRRTKKSIPHNNKRRINNSFFDFFQADKAQVLEILKGQSLKNIEIITKIYGPNYDNRTEYNMKPIDYYYLKRLIEKINNSLSNKPKSGYNNYDLPTFYDYFEEYTDEESKKLIKLYFNTSKLKGKIVASKIYDQELNYVKNELSEKEKQAINDFINKVKQFIKTSKEIIINNSSNKEEILKREIIRTEGFNNKEQQLSSFYDFFIKSSMTDEEINTLKEKIKKYIDNSILKDLVIKAYGPNYDSYNGYVYTKEENKYISHLKQGIKHSKLNKSYPPNTFYDYFIKEDMNQSEIESIKEFVKKYLDNSKSVKKQAVLKMYGPNYDTLSRDIDREDKKNVSFFVATIKGQYKYYLASKDKEKSSVKKISSNKTTPFKIDIYSLVPNAHLLMNNDFISMDIVEELLNSGGILDLYNEYKDSYKLLKELKISKELLISIYIKYLPYFTDISEIIKFIVINVKDITIIQNILSSNIFNTEDGYLTDKEKEVIYLKLLQLRDSTVTTEVISKITGLSSNEINNYHIVTKDDKINSLNKILSKKE